MRYKIGFVCSHHFQEKRFYPLFEELRKFCSVKIIENTEPESEEEIIRIYDNYANSLDGIIFSGIIQHELMQKLYPDINIPISYIQLEEKDFYKDIMRLSMQNSSLCFKRTFVDFLRLDNNYYDIYSVFDKENAPYTIKDFGIPEPVADYAATYNETIKIHEKLWAENKINLSITRRSATYDYLSEKGHNVIYLIPSNSSIIDCFQSVCDKIHLSRLEDNQPVTGIISIDGTEFSNCDLIFKFDEIQNKLYNLIEEKLSEYGFYNISITKNNLTVEIRTTQKNFKKLSDNHTQCSLLNSLINHFKYKVDIGWGIGNTDIHASKNAIKANKLSAKNGGNCMYIVINNEEFGPIYKSNEIFHSKDPKIEHLNSILPLSSANIAKIIALMKERESDQVTAEILSDYMGITMRSANRIISTLCNSNAAELLGNNMNNKAGRPARTYKINFENLI